MRRQVYLYGGLIVLLAGVAMIVFSIVEIPNEVFGYIIGALCILMGGFIVISVYISREDEIKEKKDINEVLSTIDKENPTALEEIILDLTNNTFDTKMSISNHTIIDNENIYFEVKSNRVFHVMVCTNFVEIESFNPKDEEEIDRLEEMIKQDASLRKINEKKIVSIMKNQTEDFIYLKLDITGKTKKEIINLIESSIL